jgi:tRNA 2-selenouridine synthase
LKANCWTWWQHLDETDVALKRVDAQQAIAELAAFDTVIDARSESEFAEDRLPGAVNWPVLNDQERASIGTEYKTVSAFDARKRGAALAAANIARIVQQQVQDKARGWRPLVYCWRGGQRSGSLALVLDQIGFYTQVLDGGYRAFRRELVADSAVLPQHLQLQVLCGRTGSAKTALLHTLAAAGAQVLDLEALARHKGSVLGPWLGQPQPSQKAFETALWQAMRALDVSRPVFIESESRTIGKLRVPEALLLRMRAAPCVEVRLPLQERVAFLMREYAHFVHDSASLGERLNALRDVQGAKVVQAWQAALQAGQLEQVVQELLTQHYDPVYGQSMQRHFAGLAQARVVALDDTSPASLQEAAHGLMHAAG